MTAKVCPRCGSQYEKFKSTTCPQCFAILVAVDEATAEELSAARAEVERSPEFQEAKADDDERFRQQSFSACFGIAALTLATVVLAIVLLVSAAHRVSVSHSVPATSALEAKEEPLTTLPVAAATLEDVLPPMLSPYQRRACDAHTVLTGTLTALFHGVYAAPSRKLIDVYALPAGQPTTEQNEFRLGITLASQIGDLPRPALFFATEYWHFAVLGAPGDTAAPAAFRDALAAHFGYTNGNILRKRLP